MTEIASPQSELIRLGLKNKAAEDFDRAVRYHGIMMEEGKRTKRRSPQETREFIKRIRDEKAEALTKVYQCWPGVGKTRAITEIAESYGTDFPTLVLGLSHKSFENVPREGWIHWTGHANKSRGDGETCSVGIQYEKGYRPGPGDCNCVGRIRETGRPTFAPIEYVLSERLEDDPLVDEVFDYGLWVFDEIDFNKFVGKMVVTERDLERSAMRHPVDHVRFLSEVLRDVMSEHTEANRDAKQFSRIEHWSGETLYDRFEAAWNSRSGWGFLEDQLYVLHHLNDLHLDKHSYEHWDKRATIETDPSNFAPRMSRIMWREVNDYLKGNPFNPCLHLVWEKPEEGQPVQSLYRIRWKKCIPGKAPPILVLDASAEPDLLKNVFNVVDEVYRPPVPEFPTNVCVNQLYGERLAKGSLKIDNESGMKRLPDEKRKTFQNEISSREITKSNGMPRKIGIISFKEIVDDCKQSLIEVGYSADQIVTGYYFNQRGDNEFSECDLLAIVGFPLPSPQGLYEEACALYVDEAPIIRDIESFDSSIELRNGFQVKIKNIFGYKDQRLHSLYLQKSVWELYQVFHRSRAYLKGDSDEPTHVLIFTNVPIPGVKVEGFMEEEGLMFSSLEALLTEKGEATLPELTDFIYSLPGPPPSITRESVMKRIKRAAQKGWLCEATGSTYVPGISRKQPGIFTLDKS